ncbi:uncharacterized protein LOC135434459 [Drosophila montana]|uniref:uncharacterized protein LOC135434459 n=1 Tax=Drosophila montana TaxID=40370 RepID=UPI00313AA607
MPRGVSTAAAGGAERAQLQSTPLHRLPLPSGHSGCGMPHRSSAWCSEGHGAGESGSLGIERVPRSAQAARDIPRSSICIIVEAVEKSMRPLTEPQVTHIMRNIVHGLVYIQSMDIVHRDLKLDNVHVRVEKRAPLWVTDAKIADFGLACDCPPGRQLFDIVGTKEIQWDPCGRNIDSFREWFNFCDLLAHMLKPQPEKRWNAAQISQHRFFSEVWYSCT